MKRTLSKIPAMIGMLIALLSFACYADDLIRDYILHEEPETWILAVILALVSLPFFFADAIISLVSGIKNFNKKFNITLAILLFICVITYFFFGQATGPYNLYTYSWQTFYLVIFVLEVISIVKCVKADKMAKKQ